MLSLCLIKGEIVLKWRKEIHNKLIELKGNEHTWKSISEKLTELYEHKYTSEQCRSRWRTNRHKVKSDIDPKDEYGKNIKWNENGTIEIEQLIDISKEKMKDNRYILEAHGYDPAEWDITSHRFSAWNHHNKVDGTKTLYSSKVTVKPKENKITLDDLLEVISKDTKPIRKPSVKKKTTKHLLNIPLYDMHFGVNTIDDYKDTLTRITDIIQSRSWQEIVITFGSDLLHVDNLKNTTANQTRIDDVDVIKMIEDTKTFYEILTSVASTNADKVKVLYIKGNHDESTSALLVHWLEGRFAHAKNVSVDYSIEEVKIHTFEKIFLAFSHGDKGAKRRKNVLSSQYPKEWANATVREMYTGHLHHEKALDDFGIIERTLPTRAKVDQWHKDNSFIGAHQRFQVFEYSADELLSIKYV